MSDDEPGSAMRPERDAAIRAMLVEQVRNAPEVKAARRRRNWLIWSGAGVLAIGIGATAGAVVLQATQVSNRQIVHCLSSDQRAADGSYPGSQASLASTDEQAREEVWPHYLAMMNRIGRERGWPPRGRNDFEREAGPHGALYVGAPATVAAKIVATVKALGVSRFDLKYSSGTLPHAAMMKSIELYGTEVIPQVRRLLG